MYYTKSCSKQQVSLQFSDQDASQGWPRAMVSREQHVQDDPRLKMTNKGSQLHQEVAIFL